MDFLEKPVDRKALLDAVHRAAERSRDQKVSRAATWTNSSAATNF